MTAQVVSMLFLLFANTVTMLLAARAYQEFKQQFMQMAFLSQVAVLIWHLINAYLSVNNTELLGYYLSSSMIFAAGLLLFDASRGKTKTSSVKTIFIIWLTYSMLLAVDPITPGSTLGISWVVIALLFLFIPIVTLISIPGRLGWLLAFFQLLSTICLDIGVYLLQSNRADVGGLFYFFNGFLTPIITVTFLIHSIQISKRDIEEAERKYRYFFGAVEEAFFQLSPDHKVVMVSPSISGFGQNPDALIGKRMSEVFVEQDYFDETLAGLAHEDHRVFNMHMATESEDLDCEVTLLASRTTSGEIESYFGTIKNATEKNRLTRQLAEAQRRESLGMMAGGFAHDFNNILQGIISHTELLRLSKDMAEPQQKRLSSILDSAVTAGNLCRQILQYTGKDYQSRSTVDVFRILAEVSEILTPTLPAGIRLHIQSNRQSLFVDGDSAQLHQVFFNIVRNAADALEDHGDISISVEIYRATGEKNGLPEPDFGELPIGDYIVVSIADNGPGIAPEVLPRIFDPFYSTKTIGHGLGLASVLGIVESHAGAISVKSNQPGETIFQIALPAVLNHQQPISATTSSRQGENQRILVAEDESTVREVVIAILEGNGYQVVVAEDGRKALEIFKASPGEFDGLLTDIKMPNMDGMALAHAVREIKPRLPILIASGYIDHAEFSAGQQSEFEFISKPYKVSALLNGLEKVLQTSA